MGQPHGSSSPLKECYGDLSLDDPHECFKGNTCESRKASEPEHSKSTARAQQECIEYTRRGSKDALSHAILGSHFLRVLKLAWSAILWL